jgi:hypothetical protein
MRILVLLASVAALALAPATGFAEWQYQLVDDSAIQEGCFGPCACAVLIQSPLVGSFALDADAPAGGFQVYRVLDVRWSYKSTDGVEHQVSGSGTYRVNTEQQQLVMDLSVDGGAAERYDSGLTAGVSFPTIRVAIAQNGFHCFDTVYGIDGAPQPAAVGDPAASAFMLRVGPNPFHGTAEILFALPKDGAVELRVHDLAGREVRTLAAARFNAGPHAIAWDGRDAHGARVPAGIYFVRLRTADRESRQTIVKLQ